MNCVPHSWHLYSFLGWVPKCSIYMLKTLYLQPHLQHLKIFCLSWCTLLMWFVRPDSDVHTFSQNLHWWTVPDTKPVGPLSMGFCLFPFCLVIPVGLSSEPIALNLSYSCPPALLMPETIPSKAVLPRPKSSSHFNIGYAPCILHQIFCI